MASDLRQRAFHRVLHAAPAGLGLPAGKRRAVVFNAERDAHRRRQWTGLRRPTVLALDLLDQIDRCLALFACAIAHDFVEQLTRAVLDAQIDVTACEVQLGRHLLS